MEPECRVADRRAARLGPRSGPETYCGLRGAERRRRLGAPDRWTTWGNHGLPGHPGEPPATECGRWARTGEWPQAQKSLWRRGECPVRGDGQTPAAAHA
ncbi:hypothetical protein NDU88_000836 [Pleurodeles waltl]|uniref:Uncharacterized protein n=1 Tax=Pleurodeles waltl TaxID=8319 RepID=A0AAV7U648_PLEWA|nr:hypothetical protein NDU88_000836 [Pleurodeles waltl]